MATYLTLDYLNDMPASDMLGAGTLTFQRYVPQDPTIGWDQRASASGTEPNALLHHIYRFQAVEGGTYSIFSTSYRDPFLLRIHDAQGNVIVANDEADDGPPFRLSDGGLYNSDAIFDWIAPYTGTFYVAGSWDQDTLYSYYDVSVFVDLDTAPREVQGTSGNDRFVGTSGRDLLVGGAGDDEFVTSNGIDRYVGGPGFDTASMPFDAGDYVLSKNPRTGEVEIMFKPGTHDFATEVEQFRFRDTTIPATSVGYWGSYRPELVGSVGSVYRFYNTRDKAFFYTSSAAERDFVIGNSDPNRGNINEWPYVYQGVTFETAHSYAGGTSVFRFYNTKTGHHFFTVSVAEANLVRTQAASGAWPFVDEGRAFNVYPSDPTSGAGVEVAVHRFYSPTLDRHMFTADTNEVDLMKATGVWNYEGIAFWGELPGSI